MDKGYIFFNFFWFLTAFFSIISSGYPSFIGLAILSATATIIVAIGEIKK
jgi:hypothetical protein